MSSIEARKERSCTVCVVSVVDAGSDRLERLVGSIADEAARGTPLEILLVRTEAAPDCAAVVERWRQRSPGLVRLLGQSAETVAQARNAGLSANTARWIAFCQPDDDLPAGHFERLGDFLRRHGMASLALVLAAAARADDAGEALVPVDSLEALPPAWGPMLFARERLVASDARFAPGVRPDFAVTALALTYLLRCEHACVGIVAPADALRTEAATHSREPPAQLWRDEDTYDTALVDGYLAPLDEAVRTQGHVPRWLQRAVLHDLHWYFTMDARERAPTMQSSARACIAFHSRARQVMGHIDFDVAASLPACIASDEVRHALLSYKDRDHCSTAAVTTFDREQGLSCLSYFVLGERPSEAFLAAGQPVEPAWSKYRACRFFGRTLFLQRIAWLPAQRADELALWLDGVPHPIVEAQPQPTRQALPSGLRGIKSRALRWLARRSAVRKRYAGAWVFIDREGEADDNAEHLCRWVMRNKPDVGTWFLLSPSSPHWPRLAAEGFRLVPRGLRRKLLLLNCDHLISSQPDYVSGGFDRRLYDDMMQWRYTFLRHGVTVNDQSHWLNGLPIDRMLSAGPEEYSAIVADGTPYTLSAREVRCTGLLRHDRLLEISRRVPESQVDTILVMPTWRSALARLASRAESGPAADAAAAVRDSEYACRWRELLGDPALRELADRHGKRLVFMPHSEAARHLAAFSLPPHVDVATKATVAIQELFARTALMITDYSSVAFDMAFLRRPVVYYQFDRERFFGGEHNWRPGYFDFERDGFGPVATRGDDVVAAVGRFLEQNARPGSEYLERMQRALPVRDGGSCRRAFDCIVEIRQPYERRRDVGAPCESEPTDPAVSSRAR